MDSPLEQQDFRRISDRELVKRAGQGEEAVWRELVRRHEPRVRRVLEGLIGREESVRDCIQETFAKAFRALSTYRPEFAFSTWMRRIAHNVGLNYLKKHKVEILPLDDETVEVILEGLQAPENDPLEETEARDLARTIQQVFEGMRRQHRLCYQYHVDNGWSFKEIAYIFDITEETARQFAHRARVKLRRALQADWPALAI